MNNEPIKLAPAFKDYIWGGTKLREKYNKKCDWDKVAESWELSTHKDGKSIVVDGEFSNMPFDEYIKVNKCIGKRAEQFDFFPILIKFIDAKDSLSIQVHPSDQYALKNENSYGKTEMWYVLEAEPDAFLYYGVKSEISKEDFVKSIKDNTLLDKLNKVNVKSGDVFFIESGTIHAIGAGLVICEIQQNSNLTYRVYDFDRRDKLGNTRELHVDKAVAVSQLTPSKPYVGEDADTLASCKYFTVKHYNISEKAVFSADPMCFHSIIIVNGEGELTMNEKKLSFIKGDSIFIPAQEGKYEISGNCEIIKTYV